MDWNELLTGWVSPASQSSELQQQIWDCVAVDYGQREIPTFENDAFLQHISECAQLEKSMRVLDIGCGAGQYSLALAPHVKEAVGVDISPNMIEYAQNRVVKLEMGNISFKTLDWTSVNIDDEGYTSAFDLVFAHTTPATGDIEALDKMNRCSRQFCFYEKPTRRTSSLSDAVFNEIGLVNKEVDTDIIYIFAYLWTKGYQPKFWYRKAGWESKRSIDDTTAWCINRAKLLRMLSADEESKMRAYIESAAVDGIVHEVTETTLVTIVWRVDE